jgi:hypothetical protein
MWGDIHLRRTKRPQINAFDFWPLGRQVESRTNGKQRPISQYIRERLVLILSADMPVYIIPAMPFGIPMKSLCDRSYYSWCCHDCP